MSSGAGRRLASGERKKPKPSGSTSSTPDPRMLSPFLACCLSRAKMRSCLRKRFCVFQLVGGGYFEQFGGRFGFEFSEIHAVGVSGHPQAAD